MASPYNPGLRNATALGLAMGAEAAGVTAGVVNALRLGAAISTTAMTFEGGTATKVTSETTLVIAHSLGATPTFVLTHPNLKPNAAFVVETVNSTSITVTRTTATSSWTYSYVVGV